MTQTTANNKVVTDTDFSAQPVVQPTYQVGNAPPSAGVDLLFHQAFSGGAVSSSINLPDCSAYTHLLVMVDIVSISGTTPSLTFNLFLVDSSGFVSGGYYSVWASGALSTPQQVLRGLGPGSDSVAPVPPNVQLAWSVGGTGVSSTFVITIYGKRGG